MRQYDTLNRLNALTNSWAGTFGFGYDALSRRTSLTRPNGVNTSYSYDSLSRLLSVLHQAGGTTLDGASYAYDAAGIRTSKGNYLNGLTSNYGYDALYQLLQVTGGTSESYSYDAVGNRLSSSGVPTYDHNAANELTLNSNGSYTYDNNGNTLTDPSGKSYTWDFENRLVSALVPGMGTVTFRYDPLGRRIYKSSTSGTSVYAYDGENLVEETNSSGAVAARYSQDLNIDEPLAMLRSNTVSYYNEDGLGSVTSLSNASGMLVQTYIFDSFGKQTGSSGSLANPFQYTARELDSETNLYYYRARYYDPGTGRFGNEDPARFGGGLNFYRYVANNPTLFVDPTGLMKNNRKPISPWYPFPTIVCNGQGGIRPWLPGWYNYPPQRMKCIGDCTLKHEESHIQDALSSSPNICAGSADGIELGYSNYREQNTSERTAWTVELTCLENKKKDSTCPTCSAYINDEINQAHTELKYYKSQWSWDKNH